MWQTDRAVLSSSVLLLVLSPAGPAGGASLQGVGELPGWNYFESTAEGVSGDGRVVVGMATNVRVIPEFGQVRYDQAYRSQDGVMTGMSALVPDHVRSGSEAVSFDGVAVVGFVTTQEGSGVPLTLGFRWDAGGVVQLPDLPGGPEHTGVGDISADGAIVGGYGSLPSSNSRAVLWEGAEPIELPLLAGSSLASIEALSADGSVAFGIEGTSQAFFSARWDEGGVARLAAPAGTIRSRVWGGSADGAVAVGQVTREGESVDAEAIRWLPTGFELLGGPPDWNIRSQARAASADGSVIVGSGDGSLQREAFVWDAYHGTRLLETVLEEQGVDLGAWHLESGTGISDDGLTIVGNGRDGARARGYLARLDPTPCSNGVDDDGDGLEDLEDDGCLSPFDPNELTSCADGLDNDGDGLADYGADPGCGTPDWPSERPACSNGVDDDGDGATDFPADLRCAGPFAPSEDPAPITCGIGAELALVLGWLLRRRRAASRS